jgi:hypothetical protein
VTAEGAVGWLWAHSSTVALVTLSVAAVGLLVRVGYLVALALADLRLHWRGGDAAGALADWLGARGAGGHTAFYDAYLQSDAWRAKRARVLQLAGGVCQDCGRARATDAHHLTYARLGAERPEDLRALCPRCHARAHGR